MEAFSTKILVHDLNIYMEIKLKILRCDGSTYVNGEAVCAQSKKQYVLSCPLMAENDKIHPIVTF